MRVLEFRKFGDPSQLHLAERPQPHADSNTAVIRVEAASINPSDAKNVAGKMHQTTLPRVPGRDYSGIVVDGPSDWLGAEVWGTGGDVGFTRDGTHSEYLVVPVESLLRKPATLTHEQAAATGVGFLTAWCAVVEYAALAPGETIAILGARGGVGSAATQIAKALGARVIAVDRAHPSGPGVTLADVSLVSDTPSLAAALRDANHGRGADVVFNAAGGPMFEVGLSLLAHRGRQVEISTPTERRASFDVVDFYHNESRLFGLDTLKRDLSASAAVLRQLVRGFEDASYHPPAIAKVLPLEEAPSAYELVSKGSKGRIVLKPSQSWL